MCRCRTLLAALCAAALLLGCDSGEPDATGPSVDAPAPLIALPELPPDARVTLPRPGSAMASVGPNGATLLANRVSRLRALQSLQRAAGFGLAVAEGTGIDAEVTVRAVDVPLEIVLARLLEGIPYSSHFGVDAAGARVLARVVVGEPAAAEELAALPPKEPEAPEPRERERRELTPEEREARAERRGQAQVEYLVDFDDPDPGVRAEAAEWIHAEPDVIPALTDLLARDPDAEVRARAAETLGEATESSESVQALLRALDDPSSRVVIEALEALEWVGDASVVPDVTRLLEHPNADVRDAARDTLDWVSDD